MSRHEITGHFSFGEGNELRSSYVGPSCLNSLLPQTPEWWHCSTPFMVICLPFAAFCSVFRFILCMSVCLHVCMCTAYLPVGRCELWMLGTEPGSFWRRVNALNCRIPSCCLFLQWLTGLWDFRALSPLSCAVFVGFCICEMLCLCVGCLLTYIGDGHCSWALGLSLQFCFIWRCG